MRVSLARCVRFLALRRRRRLSSWALVLCLAFVYGSLLFSGRAHAGSLSEEYRVWSKISFDGLYWKTDISQLLLAEG
ncbi:MAG: hypothetical protein KAI47_12265, partial [Deltaproteobacteria bacterium]|nr:hypothetical protein [Deltaproteobacteria bacterium]